MGASATLGDLQLSTPSRCLVFVSFSGVWRLVFGVYFGSPEVKLESLARIHCKTYSKVDFGRVENRLRREPGEESPNSIGRDAA